MSRPEHINASDSISEELRTAAREFLAQQLSVEKELGHLSVERVQELIAEMQAAQTATDESLDPISIEQIAKRAALESCVQSFCELLFLLEQSPELNLVTVPILEWVEKKPGLLVAPARVSPSEQPIFHDGLSNDIERNEISALAKQYLDISQYFNEGSRDPQFSIPHDQARRMAAQNLCFAVEAECLEKIGDGLVQAWERREALVSPLLDRENKTFTFKGAVKNILGSWVTRHPDWLWEKDLPYASLLNALRYLVATTEAERYRLSPIDAAIALLFFGPAFTGEEYFIPNGLKIEGLSKDQLIECAFRLTRIYRLRAKALLVSENFSEENFSTTKEDAKRIIELFSLLRLKGFPPKDRSRTEKKQLGEAA